MEKQSSYIFLYATLDNRTVTSGWHGAPYFRTYDRELVSKPVISFRVNRGGGAMERLDF